MVVPCGETGDEPSMDPAAGKADGPRGEGITTSKFLQALNHLTTVHDQEITALRQKNFELHRRIAEMQSTPANCDASDAGSAVYDSDMVKASLVDSAATDNSSINMNDAGGEDTKSVAVFFEEDESVDLDELLQAGRQIVDLDDRNADIDVPLSRESERRVKCWRLFVDKLLYAANTTQLFELRDQWIKPERFIQRVAKKNNQLDLGAMKFHREATHSRVFSKQDHVSLHFVRESLVPQDGCVFEPHSPVRLSWMLVGMFLMVYDLIMLPLQSFEINEDSLFLRGMQWFGQIFWTLDIIITFFTGVYISGELCQRLSTIARQYASTWLVLDLIVVVPLWIVELFDVDRNAAKSTSVFKYFRMLRFLRLARLAKFEHYLQEALATVNSPGLLLGLGIVKLMTMLFVVCHISACLWYAVGKYGEAGWVEAYCGTSIEYRYLTSVHWAITQFQGTSDILPGMGGGRDLLERAYAVVAIVFSLIILSAFVSTLTNRMMQLQNLHDAKTRQQRLIRAYVSENNISKHLSMRVKKYVDWKQSMSKGSRIGRDDGQVLQLLPGGLQMDIIEEVRGPFVLQHGFFHGMKERHPRTFTRICSDVLEPSYPAPDETIFMPQDTCTQMYFMASGLCRYVPRSWRQSTWSIHRAMSPGLSFHGQDTTVEVTVGMWLSEGVLWTSWEHLGSLFGVEDPVLLVLQEREFQRIVTSHPPTHVSAVMYARQFIAGINRFGIKYSDIVDLQILAGRSSVEVD